MSKHPHSPLPQDGNEFSRPFKVADLHPDETVLSLSAESSEREALAARFGLIAIDRLEATVHLEPGRRGTVILSADYQADVVQACVVTLNPVPAALAGYFERAYSPDVEIDGGPEEEELGEDDPPDPIIDGQIDLGEAISEQLALDLDPFPRAPDAAFTGFSTDPDGGADEKRPNPFAVLSKLKTGGKDR